MNIEITILIAVIGTIISFATFLLGRTATARKEGNSLGVMSNDIVHIKRLTERIEAKIEQSQKRLHGRIDELDRVAREADIGQRSAHKRIDEIVLKKT